MVIKFSEDMYIPDFSQNLQGRQLAVQAPDKQLTDEERFWNQSKAQVLEVKVIPKGHSDAQRNLDFQWNVLKYE